MFLGHYAAALAAKRVSPDTSLGTLVASAQLLDLLWPVMLLLGLEHVRIDPGNTAVTPLDFVHYPYTHSLLGVAGWSLLTALAVFAARRSRRAAVVVGVLVLSHWMLDVLTHRPDLPLGMTGDTRVGLGLWDSLAGTLAVELGLFAAGAWIYLAGTKPRNRRGTWAAASLLGVLGLIYLLNIVGPPPPDAATIAAAGNLSWLFVLWAWWADRNRSPLEPHAGS